jgi:4-carboxymuconolactone decarboxylase
MACLHGSLRPQLGVQLQDIHPSLSEEPTRMPRFKVLDAAEMTPDQKEIADSVLSTPGRSLATGPWTPWMRSPGLAKNLLRLGNYLRHKTSLPGRLNELAILITAREWTSQFEWYAHYPMALKAGLSAKIADQIAVDKRPEGMAADEEAVYDFCIEMHRTKRVSDATFAKARAQLSEQQVMDLIAVSGFYDLVSMTLNVGEVALPAGTPLPLAPLKR